MEVPDPRLLERFGHDFYRASLEKVASLSAPARVAGAVGSALLFRLSAERQARQEREAQVLNMMFRALEEQRMENSVRALGGQAPALSMAGEALRSVRSMQAYRAASNLHEEGMVRYASAVGASMAKSASAALRKEAFGAFGGNAVMSLGRSVSSIGGRLAGGLRAQRGLLRPASVSPTAGARMPHRSAPAQTAGLARSSAQAAPAAQVPRKPLLGWKTKAGLTAAGLGTVAATGYGAAQVAGAAKNYLMQPTYASNAWGGRGLAPAGDVNQYGYTDVYR